jgi:hypothetical protein
MEILGSKGDSGRASSRRCSSKVVESMACGQCSTLPSALLVSLACNAIIAMLGTAQFNRPPLVAARERVVDFLAFAASMSLRASRRQVGG